MPDQHDFEGRRILVTGAASGIGRATAQAFAATGARLALIDRDAKALATLRAEIGGVDISLDLENEDAIRDGVAAAAQALGGLDGVVNVAGIGGFGQIEELTTAQWNKVLRVNLTAPFLVIREALPHLRAARDATVVNIASGQGLLSSIPGMTPYHASKGGLITLSKAMAIELAPIRVNVVCPGVVDTPLITDSIRASATAPASPYALKRIAMPAEIADAILFLSSPRSSFVTGTALAVDGGRTYH